MGTVRSVAQARNRPRTALAWTLCLVLVFITVFLLSLRVVGAAPRPTSPIGDVDDAAALADDLLVDDAVVEDVLVDDLLAGDDDALAHSHDVDAVPRTRGRGSSVLRRIDVSLGYRRRADLAVELARAETPWATRVAHEVWLTAGWTL